MAVVLEWATVGALAVLSLSALLCVLRIAFASSVAERIIGLDTLLVVVLVMVIVQATRTESGVYLDVVLAMALVAFIGSTAVARFIERRGVR